MFGVNSYEILIILVVMVLLFGASRIPELGKSLGSGIREFKNGLRAIQEDDEEDKKKINQKDEA